MPKTPSKTKGRAAVAVQRIVRPENGNARYVGHATRFEQALEQDGILTEQSLRILLSCQYAFEHAVHKDQSHLLTRSLARWKSLGFPRPRFSLLNKCFSEWHPEFEQFLDSYNFRSNDSS
jgi:hypothetical protein